MRTIALVLGFIGLCLAASVAPQAAHAQATRTWVSGVGDDANPCSRTAPCKTFAGAISKTAAAGEINCLDPGGFGALTITKSIIISCEAGTAGVLVSGTNGITVSAASTDVVELEGLDIEGINSGLIGVSVLQAGVVTIKNCDIRGFTQNGVGVTPGSNGVQVEIIDSVISDNTGSGVFAKPTGSVGVRVDLNRDRLFQNGGDGVTANGNATTGGVKFSIRDTEASDNTGNGFAAFSSGPPTQLMIDSSSAFNNATGVVANGSSATIRVTRTQVSANTTGVSQLGGGSVLSYGTNSIGGNATDGTPSSTPQN